MRQHSCWPTGIDLLAMGPAYCSAYVRLHCLVNGLPHWATGHLVRQQAGPSVNVRDSRMPPCAGATGACRGTLTAAAPRPNCWQLASAGREANIDNDHLCRVPAAQLTEYMYKNGQKENIADSNRKPGLRLANIRNSDTIPPSHRPHPTRPAR